VAEALRATPQGTLRVTAPISWGAHRLVPVVGAYMAVHPQVKVELSLNDRVVDMQEEGFDVAVRSGAISDPLLIARPLRPSRMLAVASPAYLAMHAKPRRPEDLQRHNCLGFTPWGHDHAWRFAKGDRKASVPVRGSLVCNNGQALLTAALCGAGVVVQADVLLEPAIASGQLVRLLPGWELPTRALHILRRRETRPTAKLRSFVDFVVEQLG
jgi:DNA-binding transcriptional LysR family regulator